MYENLDKVIKENGMSCRTVASAINMAESTFRYKMTDGAFSIEEAFNIKYIVFPKYDMDFLFRKDSIPA